MLPAHVETFSGGLVDVPFIILSREDRTGALDGAFFYCGGGF